VKLLLWTQDDPASLRIAQFLRQLYGSVVSQPRNAHYGPLDWMHEWGAALCEVKGSLLNADYADRTVKAHAGMAFDRALFLSKHSAESGRASFTIHPVGNWGKDAKLGGKPHTLAPSDPEALRNLFVTLAAEAAPTGIAVTLESTHHGPLMDIPSLFVEVGSTKAEWENEDYCFTLARAIVRGYLEPTFTAENNAAVGLGGGHYHPLPGDAVRKNGAAFGHLLPRHAFAEANEAVLGQAVRLSHAKRYLADPRGADAKELARIVAVLESLGLTRLDAPR